MKKRSEEWYDCNANIYKSLTEKVRNIICEILDDEKIPVHNVTIRIKTKDSFLEKITRKNYKNPEIDITDLAGIRIVGYVDSDIKKISTIIQNEFKIDKENSLDKSKLLGEDKVGYKSTNSVRALLC